MNGSKAVLRGNERSHHPNVDLATRDAVFQVIGDRRNRQVKEQRQMRTVSIDAAKLTSDVDGLIREVASHASQLTENKKAQSNQKGQLQNLRSDVAKITGEFAKQKETLHSLERQVSSVRDLTDHQRASIQALATQAEAIKGLTDQAEMIRSLASNASAIKSALDLAKTVGRLSDQTITMKGIVSGIAEEQKSLQSQMDAICDQMRQPSPTEILQEKIKKLQKEQASLFEQVKAARATVHRQTFDADSLVETHKKEMEQNIALKIAAFKSEVATQNKELEHAFASQVAALNEEVKDLKTKLKCQGSLVNNRSIELSRLAATVESNHIFALNAAASQGSHLSRLVKNMQRAQIVYSARVEARISALYAQTIRQSASIEALTKRIEVLEKKE